MSRLGEWLTAAVAIVALIVVLLLGMRHYDIQEYKAQTDRHRVVEEIDQQEKRTNSIYEACINTGLDVKYCEETYGD